MSADVNLPAPEAGPAPASAPAPAAAVPQRKRNIFALFFGMIVSPRATLAYLRENGGLSWIWPALLAIVLLVVALVVAAPITRAAAEKQLEAMKELYTEQQYQQVVAMATNPVFTLVVPAAMSAVGLILGWLIRGGLYYLMNLAFGGQGKFGAIFRMTVWVTLPDLVRQIVNTVGIAATGRVLKAGLGGLVAAPEGVTIPPLDISLWQTFLGGIDIYWLWGMVLAVIGVAVTAKVSWRKGLVITLIYWVLAVLFALGSVWLGLFVAQQAGGAALGG